MVKIVSRRSLQLPKVISDGMRLAATSSVATAGMQGFYTLPMTPQPPSNSLGSGNTLYFDIERDSCGEVNDLCLRLTVSCSNADVTTSPTFYWLKRLVIESEKGSGDEYVIFILNNSYYGIGYCKKKKQGINGLNYQILLILN